MITVFQSYFFVFFFFIKKNLHTDTDLIIIIIIAVVIEVSVRKYSPIYDTPFYITTFCYPYYIISLLQH